MTKSFAVSTLLLVAALAAGCASGQPDLPEARCRAAGGAAMLGQPANQRTIDQARMGAGALRTQVVPYRAAVANQDVDPLRLTVEVDGKGIIQKLRCG